MSKQTDLINIPDAIKVDGTKVGIGTTPSATYPAFDTIEFNTASIISQNTATGGASPDGNLVLGSNMNYSSGGGPEYKVTGKATQITQIDGNITLGVATSGTANTNITYNTGLEVLNDGYARAKNGLLFGTDTAAANALNDYEYGSWTPTTPNAGSATPSNAVYTKIGDQVTVWCLIQTFTDRSTATSLTVKGLPFNATNTGVAVGTCMCQYVANTVHTIYMSGSSGLQFYKSQNGSGFVVLNHSDLQNSAAQIYLMATYTAA
jgi:hypothetical protein